jgi:O-antigen/teichoic acid export membrane protein
MTTFQKPRALERAGFSRNVSFAWVGFLAQAATGFVMPRLIGDALGQATLGVWDLAWSVIAYLGFLELGLSGSVNRFVAQHLARNDLTALTRSVSTVALFLKAVGVLVALGALAMAMWGLPLFAGPLGAELQTAQLVVVILGAEMAISISLAANLGVIVGCLRSDLHYAVSTAVSILTLVGMVTVVTFAGGLPAIALIHMVVVAGGEVARWRIARTVCPQLTIDYSTVSWSIWREQARFTAKTASPTVADILANHSTSVLIALHLGPSALAVFSRPRNLVRQVRTLVARVGYILAPAASSLQAQAKDEELKETVLEKSFQVALLTIPASALLAVLGDDVIRLWMGAEYVQPWLMAIISLGTLPSLIQEPAWSVMSGMNRHGRLAMARLAGSLCSVMLTGVALWAFRADLRLAAALLLLPTAIVDGLIVPVYVCRAFDVTLRGYVRETWIRPLVHVSPFIVALTVARWVLNGEPLAAVKAAGLSAPLLAVGYWIAHSWPVVLDRFLGTVGRADTRSIL